VTTELPSIAIIGAGAMGGAILQGLLDPSVSVSGGIRVTNRTAAKAALVAADGVESIALESEPDGNQRAVRGAGIVLLGVKPAMILDTLRDLELDPGTLVVSVAAGITTASMEAVVDNPVLRAMPNTPAIVGKAVTGVAAGSRATAADVALGVALFETVGTVVEIPESQIDALSTISGSGPAYYALLAEAMIEAGILLGLSREVSTKLVVQTMLGTAKLLRDEHVHPVELREAVTSPGGTTIRAIRELEQAGVRAAFLNAINAAMERSKELARGDE